MDKVKIKNLSINAVLFLVVAMFCTIPLEVAFRYVRDIPLDGSIPLENSLYPRDQIFSKSKNEIILHELRPNSEAYYHGVNIKVNSQGMRDREYSVDKPEGVFRIAVLGDSLVFGFGVELNNTYTKLLEAELNKLGVGDIEVLNFGMPGFGTKEEAEYWRVKAKMYDPDLVILGYCLNDEIPKPGRMAPIHSSYFSITEKFYVFDFIKDHIDNFLENYLGIESIKFHERSNVSDDFRYLKQEIGETPEVIVVVFPRIFTWKKYKKHWIDHHNRILLASKESGFHHIDILKDYMQYYPKDLRLIKGDDYHPTSLGHSLAAIKTKEYLIQQNMI